MPMSTVEEWINDKNTKKYSILLLFGQIFKSFLSSFLTYMLAQKSTGQLILLEKFRSYIGKNIGVE